MHYWDYVRNKQLDSMKLNLNLIGTITPMTQARKRLFGFNLRVELIRISLFNYSHVSQFALYREGHIVTK